MSAWIMGNRDRAVFVIAVIVKADGTNHRARDEGTAIVCVTAAETRRRRAAGESTHATSVVAFATMEGGAGARRPAAASFSGMGFGQACGRRSDCQSQS